MGKLSRREKIEIAYSKDSSIFGRPGEKGCMGKNPQELLDLHGITKGDLIQLYKDGFAVKAMYREANSKKSHGTQHARWFIFKEVLDYGM